MSDRTERKLQQVVVGRYGYRHEAEFAAGFLDDAGIPYRLQVDDPVLGFSLSASPATIWVLGVDERRARAVLDHDMPAIEAGASDPVGRGDAPDEASSHDRPGLASGGESARGASEALSAELPSRSSAVGAPDVPSETDARDRDGKNPPGHRPPVSSSADPRHPSRRKAATVLGARERILALVSGSALGVLTRLVDLGGAAGATLVVAALLVVIGVAGRAPAPVKRTLAALSGESP